MIPLSAVWAGPERDEHLQRPLLFGKTEGSTPFRFSPCRRCRHTLIVGPTGAGKSVLLALMALQFRRYAGAQVFAFDFGGSIRAAALAMGGDWHDLGGDLTDGQAPSAFSRWPASTMFPSLGRRLDRRHPDPRRRRHHPGGEGALWTALTSLASAPVEERTITGLCVLLQSNDLKQALRAWPIGGPYGRLLDAEREHLGTATVQAFETEG
jgi:type IV secretion system protein VirB4